jgi:hypothetical protein
MIINNTTLCRLPLEYFQVNLNKFIIGLVLNIRSILSKIDAKENPRDYTAGEIFIGSREGYKERRMELGMGRKLLDTRLVRYQTPQRQKL